MWDIKQNEEGTWDWSVMFSQYGSACGTAATKKEAEEQLVKAQHEISDGKF